MNPLKMICIALGFVFFGLAAIGAFFPVLPTTPFLLLAAFFFARGSERFNRWFIHTKLYQDYVDSFIKHRTMTRKTKIFICSLAFTMMLISVVLVDIIWVKLFLIAMMGFMFYYFRFRIKTVSPEEDAAIKAQDKAEREATAHASVTLKETFEEVREMHEDMLEESQTSCAVKKQAKEEIDI